jgi:nucleoid-associated protein YgaU
VTPTEEPAAETEQPAAKTEEPAVAAQAEPEIEQKSTDSAAATVANEAQSTEPKKGRIIIQPGNNLWKLSRVIYGKGMSYTVIYEANKGQIRDPDLIYPGQIFATPNAVPPETIDPKRKKPLSAEEGGTIVQ